jgi:hypothetical protein
MKRYPDGANEMLDTAATVLFHEALEALASGNLTLAHDKALSAASQYAREGSLSSARMAAEVALHPEKLINS